MGNSISQGNLQGQSTEVEKTEVQDQQGKNIDDLIPKGLLQEAIAERQKWKNKYRALEAESNNLKDDFEGMKNQFESSGKKQLSEKDQRIDQLIKTVDSVKREMEQYKNRFQASKTREELIKVVSSRKEGVHDIETTIDAFMAKFEPRMSDSGEVNILTSDGLEKPIGEVFNSWLESKPHFLKSTAQPGSGARGSSPARIGQEQYYIDNAWNLTSDDWKFLETRPDIYAKVREVRKTVPRR